MPEQQGFVDFNEGAGDTGQDNLESIQPFVDGEGATQTVLRRPPENLRARTEILRAADAEHYYYRDNNHLMIEYTGGTITWNGPGPGAAPLGQISVTGGTFTLSPMLSPSTSYKGSLAVGTGGVNQITYSVAAGAYATEGMNAITVAHIDGGAATALAVTITAGPVKRIVVVFDSTNTSHDAAAVKAAVDVAISGDSVLSGKITTATSAVALNTIDAQTETRLEGTADDEKHVITAADIQTLTTATPLEPGMGVAIWYRYVIEPASGDPTDPKGVSAGGRAESSGSRGTSTIPSASLFVTDEDPQKIPGAIPICKVGFGGQLIFYDGTRLEAGESFDFESVVTQIGNFAAALAAGTGTGVGVNTSFTAAVPTQTNAGGIGTGVTTLDDALTKIDAALIRKRSWTAVFTDGSTTVGGDYDSFDAIDSALDSTYANGGSFFLRAGTYTPTPGLTVTTVGRYVCGENPPLNFGADTYVNISNVETNNVKANGVWENINFLNSSSTYMYEVDFVAKFINCRIPMGSMHIINAARVEFEGCTFYQAGATSIANAGMYVAGNAYFRRCIFENPTHGGGFNTITVDPGGANDGESIIFDKCQFNMPNAYVGSASTTLRISSGNGGDMPITFRDCRFSMLKTSYEHYTIVDEGHTFPVTFENCYVNTLSGHIADVQGGNTTFSNCTFVTGDDTYAGNYRQVISAYGPPAVPGMPFKMRNCRLTLGTSAVDPTGLVNSSNYPILEFGGRQASKSTFARIQYDIDGLYVDYSSGVANAHAASSFVFWSDGANSGNDPRPIVRNFEFNGGTITPNVDGGSRGIGGGDAHYVEMLGSTNASTLSGSRIRAEHFEIFVAGNSDVPGATDTRGIFFARESIIKDLQIHISSAAGTKPFVPTGPAVIQFITSFVDTFRFGGAANIELTADYVVFMEGKHSASGIGNARWCKMHNAFWDELTWPSANNPTFAFIGLGELTEIKDSEFLNIARNTSPAAARYFIIRDNSADEYITIENCKFSTPSGAANNYALLFLDSIDGLRVINNLFYYNTGSSIAFMSVGGCEGYIITGNQAFNTSTGVLGISPALTGVGYPPDGDKLVVNTSVSSVSWDPP